LAQGGILDSNSQPQNSTKTYWHKPLFGLAQQHLYAPLWSLTGNGLTFEFLLQGSGLDAVVGTNTALISGSGDWTIQNVKLHMDILHVDDALMASYSTHLLKGSSLVVPFRSYTNLSFTHDKGPIAQLQIPRTFSRVNQVWVLPSKPGDDLAALKDGNYFPGLNSESTLESWIMIGSTKFPSSTYGKGTRAHLMRYQKALGFLSSGFHTTSNTLTSYNLDSMIMIFDLEKVPQQAMSGLNTAGGNMTINIQGLGTAAVEGAAGTGITRLDVLIWHDVLAEIQDGSVQISF
jgi:hypothetical protein